jgi:hypothetical protein
MLGSKPNQAVQLACPKCQERFPAATVAFLCPEQTCPARKKPLSTEADYKARWTDRPVFRPKTYAYSVDCEFSPHKAYIKICPRCWEQLPIPTGRSSTIAVVGATASGKTCYTTALIRQIRKELSQPHSHEISLEWEDDEGKKYFREQEGRIFGAGTVPEPTQKITKVASMQITVRIPVRHWFSRLRRGEQGVVSIVFHDPAGEYFESMKDIYYLHYVSAAEGVILMVDPFTSEEYQQKLREQGEARPVLNLVSARDTLDTFVKAIRNETNQQTGKLRKQLAVVLTKCDEPGMFDPDAKKNRERFPVQGRSYDPALAEDLSNAVAKFMTGPLGMSDVVALARNSFEDVAFFAASALGSPPVLVENDRGEVESRLNNPRPRRVEEPLLWILHKWGHL